VLAAEVLAAAEARGDAEQALIGHTQLAVPEHYQANSHHRSTTASARSPSTNRRDTTTSRVCSARTNAVGALGYMAWNLWHLGRPDHALACAEESVALARRLRHPFSLAFALFFEAATHWSRRDHERQGERAEELIALSEAQGFPLWLGLGRAWHAAARLSAGDLGALDELAGGLALAGETGSQAGAPALFGLLAEAQHAAGQLVAAQGALGPAWRSRRRRASRSGTRSSIGSMASCFSPAVGHPTRSPPVTGARSPSPARRARAPSRCGRR
jgi:hypothetical protein